MGTPQKLDCLLIRILDFLVTNFILGKDKSLRTDIHNINYRLVRQFKTQIVETPEGLYVRCCDDKGWTDPVQLPRNWIFP